jgi:dTDP-glucose 4,6-dehydratase
VRRTLQEKPEVKITVLDALTYAGRLGNLTGVLESIEFHQGNILDTPLVSDLVRDCDLVVHFAAESHNDNSLRDPRPFIQTNINGTFELIQAATKYDKRFHHISTDEVFGDLPLDSKNKFEESTPYAPSSPYSASKASSDHLVRAWVRSFGLRATITNCSNNFGPYQHEEKLIPRTALLVADGQRPKVYGNGNNVRDWIHVNDHTDGVWAVLEKGELGETYLLGASNERTNLQVVEAILEILGKPTDFIDFVEDRVGHDLRYAIDSRKAQSDLDWKPRLDSFEAQLPEVVDHYLASNLT